MIKWQTGDIIKIKNKTYEIWEEGNSSVILKSLCDSRYFVTLHKTSPYLQPYATTRTEARA